MSSKQRRTIVIPIGPPTDSERSVQIRNVTEHDNKRSEAILDTYIMESNDNSREIVNHHIQEGDDTDGEGKYKYLKLNCGKRLKVPILSLKEHIS